MIEVRGLSKVYQSKGRPVRALDGVDLTVADGEFLAVRGPSGSGKSTLLLTIGGMVRPTEGRAVLNGTDLYGLSGGERANYRARNIGFVFQMFHLAPYLTVLDNVLLPTGLVDRGGPSRARALELLERFGMAERLDHRPGQLSTGERQRTAIARALVNDPWLVLADEPTGNLDPETGAEILAYLKEFNDAGRSVVLVTHEPWVEEYAHRTVHLKAGRCADPTPG